jgi:hypothetical protein
MKASIVIGFLLLGTSLFGQSVNTPVKPLDQKYSWEKPHAKVLETGDLQWQPEPFKYIAGSAVRYIDFDEGNDSNDGKTSKTAWKHHPWDSASTGNAQGAGGIFTYVFKRGVVYRGVLNAKESGEPGNPIRLTSDPSWGKGEACMYGSMRFTSGWAKANAEIAPKIPEPEKVWYHDISGNIPDTKEVCELSPKGIKRVRLARTPNYRNTPDDLLRTWNAWTKKEYDDVNKCLLLSDKINLTQSDPEYYLGGTAWSEEDAENMCTIWGQRIKAYDPSKNSIAVENRKFGGVRSRYFIENTPFLLDTTSEFYYDHTAKRMFLRLDKDKDPNTTTIEVAAMGKLILAEDKHDIVISGLTFGFTTSDATRISENELVAVIQLSGTCYNIEISHNKFTYVNSAISARNPTVAKLTGHDILVSDNDIYVADDLAIAFTKGGNSYFDKIKIFRNRVYDNGARHLSRWSSSVPAITGALIEGEIAGNIVNISWGNGLNFSWGKAGRDSTTNLPFIRGLVHHNKASNTLIGTNDYGGIENWQGGPIFVYDNISHNALGYRHFDDASKGQAFYFDGTFKYYAFNNIATGYSWKKSSAGYMTVLGFYNMTVHNTGFRLRAFSTGAVNELDSDGHNEYLANIGDSVSYMFKTSMQPDQETFESFGNNVFSRTPFRGSFITDQALKRAFWGEKNLVDLATFKKNLEKVKPQLAEVGVQTKKPVLPRAAAYDFRPAAGSEAIGKGVKFFAAFPLYANVGEWNFYKHPADSSVIMAENFYMTTEYGSRNSYYKVANNNLKAHGITLKSFVKGKLEDWTEGALTFDGKQTYCDLDYAVTSKKVCTNVDMTTNNFIIEAVFKTEKGHKEGTLVSKYDPSGNGYKLDFDQKGKVRLSLISSGKTAYSISCSTIVNDGLWHHLLAEVDRSGKTNIYVDGKLSNGSSAGVYPSPTISLTNSSDLLIGKSPEGNFFKGTLDFLRISKGTLKDARTTIQELYKWELDGPFLRDFTGKKPIHKRDAGAIGVE